MATVRRAPTTNHSIRVDDGVWDQCKVVAEATGQTVSGMVVSYLNAIAGGKTRPIEHVPNPDTNRKPTIGSREWEHLQPIMAKIIGKATADFIRDLRNPMAATITAKTAGAQEPSLAHFNPAPRKRAPIRTSRQPAGELLDPETCEHPENLRRRVLGHLYCACGKKVS